MPPISCEEVWHEISNYIDNDVDLALRAEMEAHFKKCKRCVAVLDGARNVIELVGDGRCFTVPAGFSRRLEKYLSSHISGEVPSAPPTMAISAQTWWASAIAACLIFAFFVAFRAHDRVRPTIKSHHSQPAVKQATGMVAISDEGKTFHVPGCPYLHGKGRLVPIQTAIKDGFVPCARCEHALLAG